MQSVAFLGIVTAQQAWRMIFVTPDAIERRRWPRDVFLVVGTGQRHLNDLHLE